MAMTDTPAIGIVTGSGIVLDALLDHVESRREFDAFPGLAKGTVPGHDHTFVEGRCGDVRVILQCGRLHFYEGLSYEEVVRPVDVLRDLGAAVVLFTNAAGGLLPDLAPGDLVAANRVRLWPYAAWKVTPGILFPDFVPPGCIHTGTYQWVPGPSYETQAEIQAMHHIRCATVGMSTGPELLRCQELGMHGGVISCVTNNCCQPHKLTHDEVVTVAKQTSGKIAQLVRAMINPGTRQPGNTG